MVSRSELENVAGLARGLMAADQVEVLVTFHHYEGRQEIITPPPKEGEFQVTRHRKADPEKAGLLSTTTDER